MHDGCPVACVEDAPFARTLHAFTQSPADVRGIVRDIVRRGPKPLCVMDSASLRAELDRRLDAYDADGDPGRPAGHVIADIRKKLRSRKKSK
jgi:hypothetical protein